LAFVGTFKNDYVAEIMEGRTLDFSKGESFEILDETTIFYLLNIGGTTPICIRKELIEKSGYGVEWYSSSFYQLQKDKKSWKKKFRMHTANETDRFTYEINMRYLDGVWEFAEVNQYTNGTDANKIGQVNSEAITSRLFSILHNDERFTTMLKETDRQFELMEKLSKADFLIDSIKWEQRPWSRSEVKLTIFLKGEAPYRLIVDYNPLDKEFNRFYLSDGKEFFFNYNSYITQEAKEKFSSYPPIDEIKLE
jgi:hypothetical protein